MAGKNILQAETEAVAAQANTNADDPKYSIYVDSGSYTDYANYVDCGDWH